MAVAEELRNEALPRRLKGIGPDSPYVIALANADRRQRLLFCLFQGDLHRLLGNHLSPGQVAIEDGRRRGFPHQNGLGAWPDLPLVDVVSILLQANEAVRVVASEVSAYEMVGDEESRTFRRAKGFDDVRYQGKKGFGSESGQRCAGKEKKTSSPSYPNSPITGSPLTRGRG